MGTEITKAPQQSETRPTWKRLYEAAWEQGFKTFMLILSQQYKIELMIQAGNQKQPSPVIEFWRNGLKGLSPKQMTEGLRAWQRTEHGGFQPTPEDIQNWGMGIEATDAPKRKLNPDCVNCGGTGFRYVDGRKWSERDSNPRSKLTRCDCAVIIYGDTAYKSTKLTLTAGAGHRQIERTDSTPLPEIPEGKAFPERRDLDLDKNAEKLRQQAEMLTKSEKKGGNS